MCYVENWKKSIDVFTPLSSLVEEAIHEPTYSMLISTNLNIWWLLNSREFSRCRSVYGEKMFWVGVFWSWGICWSK